ncbi:magnesium transporter [Pseudomonas citronellolis]|uniref:magnesium transporter n=1 Tax=Pseudomonas citronellolis TaxID=53408 RepID=UPI0023E3F238|nr:magnesium transporter [Pseudomonas citronellolis]MDF3934753.1 magnesium transporter [Pseudomonas citronellolis]
MNRHYYISDNLDELEDVEHELQGKGIAQEQMHVLSEQDAQLDQRHLHEVPEVMRKDLVRGGKYGLGIGVALAALVLLLGYVFGWSESAAGWVPVLFLAAVLLGFSLWEGSFFGLQRPSGDVQRFAPSLHAGRHVFFVDVRPEQEPLLDMVVGRHPQLAVAGFGAPMPRWVLAWEQAWHRFRRMM